MRFHFSLFVLLLCSCVKDKPQPVPQQPVTVSGTSQKVYVICEGTFGAANADVTLFEPASSAVVERYYREQNAQSPGDVLQSIAGHNGLLYLTVNNSSRIVVCDRQMKKISNITGLTSPRFMLPVSNSRAYVSDLKANAVSVVDLTSNTVKTKIPLSGWSEQMVQLYHKVFVTNLRRPYLYVIDASKDVLVDSIATGMNASSVVIDKKERVWVLSAGEDLTGAGARLQCIDPISHSVLLQLAFTHGSPRNLCLNKTRDTLYFLNDDVYRMSVESKELPAVPLISKGSRNFYGLGVNPATHELFVSDALNYIERSNIHVYSAQGQERRTFKSWINASGFYFE